MNYIKFSNEFYYKENIPFLNKIGFRRTFKNFHLVDMYPSLKVMKRFYSYNNKELKNIIAKHRHFSDKASIYIHFPFCKNFCSYCHLYKENICKNKNLQLYYINSLKREIEFYSKIFNIKIKAKSIYFGGGTPSLMSNRLLSEILNTLKNEFIITNDSFISFEVFPESNFNKNNLLEKLKLLKSFGTKEIVLDLQSTNLKSLREVGRENAKFSSWKKIAKLIKDVGIPRIKTSIIIGLPFDDLNSLKRSIFDIIDIEELSTISLFLLEFRKNLRIFNELVNNRYKFCNEEERDKMQIMARKILNNNGFYESPIHFFNRKKYRVNKNNKPALVGAYKDHLLGFGPSSYGHIVLRDTAIKYYNCADIKKYIHKINQRELPISRWYILNQEEKAISKLINDINSEGIINKNDMILHYNFDIEKKFGKIFDAFEKLNLIKRKDNKIIITELGKIRIEEMLWYLYDDKYKTLQRKFSKNKEVMMHNYTTIISKRDEEKFNKFMKLMIK